MKEVAHSGQCDTLARGFGCTRKHDEQAMGASHVNSIPPWPLALVSALASLDEL